MNNVCIVFDFHVDLSSKDTIKFDRFELEKAIEKGAIGQLRASEEFENCTIYVESFLTSINSFQSNH